MARVGRFTMTMEILSKIVVPIVVAVLGTGVGHYYNELAVWKNNKSEVLAKTVPYLRSSDKEVRHLATMFLMGFDDRNKMADFFLSYLQSKEKQIERTETMGGIVSDDNGKDKVIEILNDPNNPAKDNVPNRKAIVPPSDDPQGAGGQAPARVAELKQGWVLLGRYDAKVDCWSEKEFAFKDNQSPATLKGIVLRSEKEKTSVWERSPGSFGSKGELLCTIEEGSELRVINHKDWIGTGYIWAKVAYQVKD